MTLYQTYKKIKIVHSSLAAPIIGDGLSNSKNKGIVFSPQTAFLNISYILFVS